MDTAPIHVQLRRALLLECASGKFSQGQRFYSHRKISRLWKISNTTATSSVNWLVEMKIIQSRHRSGYYLLPNAVKKARLLLHQQPNPQLPSPATFSTRRFQYLLKGATRARKVALIVYGKEPADGFVETKLDSPALRNIWSRGFFDEAMKHGCEFQCFLNNGNVEQQKLIARRVLEEKVDGVAIFMRTWKTSLHPMLHSLLAANIPVVRVFGDSEHTEVPTINVNNVSMGYEAIRRFLRFGHRRIGVLIEPRNCRDFFERVDGCRFALEESGMEAADASITVLRCSENRPIPKGFRAKFEDPERRLTALFSTRIELFRSTEPLLKQLGLRVPEDISVIACGGVSRVPNMERAVDSFVIDFDQMGRRAFEALVELMEGRLQERSQLIDVPYHQEGTVAPRTSEGSRQKAE